MPTARPCPIRSRFILRRPARRAFSLLELTLVVAIMGLLMAVVAWNIAGQNVKQKRKLAYVGLQSVKAAIDAYNIDQSAYPADMQNLVTLKLVEAKKLVDPWKTPYVYDPRRISEDQPFSLSSSGPDRVAGNTDDISVWEEPTEETKK